MGNLRPTVKSLNGCRSEVPWKPGIPGMYKTWKPGMYKTGGRSGGVDKSYTRIELRNELKIFLSAEWRKLSEPN